jgi:7-carboxy-7-deazaguanine synthase
LQVQEIFPTLQGEGPHTGVPSVFVRLGGCNLACHFCDTEFESFREMTLDEVLAEIQSLTEDSRKLVVITGGEPLRQNIVPLCQLLIDAGYLPQIETNGTLWRDLPQGVDIICSPKAAGGEYHPLRADMLARVTALKFIISKTCVPYNTVPYHPHNIPIWVQPMDEYDAGKNAENLDYTIQLAEQHGYKLSLQTHKLFALD